MIDRRAAWSLPLTGAAIFAACFALARREPIAVPSPESSPPRIAGPAPAPPIGPLRWIVAGGGPSPDLNQVQLEQDVALAREVFSARGAGLVLFAGGPGSNAVQVLADTERDALRAELAALFDPRNGRDARYRASTLAPDGAASAEAILAAIEGAIEDGDGPLTIYLAGHGDGGEEPRDARFLTWGSTDLSVLDLASHLDASPRHRPVRIVMTSCFSGGFAELAFGRADPDEGPATTDRCGLFATLWDRPAAGCDPNPDRGAQQGYGIHFLAALRGRDRGGDAIDVDLDDDGTISLLEAHTRARIASGSIDVPTSTSERFLRAAVDERAGAGRLPPSYLVEERAVITGLTERLGLARPEEARAELARRNERLEALASELDELDEALAHAEDRLIAALLHRWPLLDDPWHPHFARELEAHREDIAAFFEDAAESLERDELTKTREALDAEHDALRVEAAPYERVVRALDTLELAGRLRAEGGRYWLRYEAFLACERGAP